MNKVNVGTIGHVDYGRNKITSYLSILYPIDNLSDSIRDRLNYFYENMMKGTEQYLNCFTLEDIKNWDFVEKTPSGGNFYKHPCLPIAGTVYRDYGRLWYNLKEGYTMKPCNFEDNILLGET